MRWWADQMININNYPYSGMGFRCDPDLRFPPRSQWGAIGLCLLLWVFLYNFIFYFFWHILFFGFLKKYSIFCDDLVYLSIFILCADMGPVHLEVFLMHCQWGWDEVSKGDLDWLFQSWRDIWLYLPPLSLWIR